MPTAQGDQFCVEMYLPIQGCSQFGVSPFFCEIQKPRTNEGWNFFRPYFFEIQRCLTSGKKNMRKGVTEAVLYGDFRHEIAVRNRTNEEKTEGSLAYEKVVER